MTTMSVTRFLLPTIAVLLSFPASPAMTQQPTPSPAPVSPRPARTPQPDKPFEPHEMTPEVWKLFDKDAKLGTMGTGFAFTEGPVWDPAGFLWVSDERKNKIVKLYPDGHTEDMVSLVDPDGSTMTNSIDC